MKNSKETREQRTKGKNRTKAWESTEQNKNEKNCPANLRVVQFDSPLLGHTPQCVLNFKFQLRIFTGPDSSLAAKSSL